MTKPLANATRLWNWSLKNRLTLQPGLNSNRQHLRINRKKQELSMSDKVALVLAGGLIAAVLLALIMNRRLKVWWGNKGVRAGGDEPSGQPQNMTATGRGSSIEEADQIQSETSQGQQTMRAENRGKLKGVRQHIGIREEKK